MIVIPAQAGTQNAALSVPFPYTSGCWVPAFAGMTGFWFCAAASDCYIGDGRTAADEALANPVRSGRKQP